MGTFYFRVSKSKQPKLAVVIPAKAGIQKKNTGFRIKCGMTSIRKPCSKTTGNYKLIISVPSVVNQ